MMRKVLTTAWVLGVTAMASVAFAAVTRDRAIEIAKAETSPAAAVFECEEEFAKFEIKLQDTAKMIRYDVDVDKSSGRILEVDVKHAVQDSSPNVVKTEADIRAVVLAEYPDAQIIGIRLDREDYGQKYEVRFSSPKFRYAELDINPETGVIAERELKYN